MSVYLAIAMAAASAVNENARIMEERRVARMTPEQRADYYRKREVEALERQASAMEHQARESRSFSSKPSYSSSYESSSPSSQGYNVAMGDILGSGIPGGYDCDITTPL